MNDLALVVEKCERLQKVPANIADDRRGHLEVWATIVQLSYVVTEDIDHDGKVLAVR